ncbi:hypothetical protein Tco_1061374, partial [Tanacetum coccineum]
MREGRTRPRILWKNINGDAAEAFRMRLVEGVITEVEGFQASDTYCMWDTLVCIIKDAAKKTLGVAIGRSNIYTASMESWWLCEEVQSKVAAKQARFRELLSCLKDKQWDTIKAEE